jgi:flagella basal body P-ring formation protein FlgA
MAMMGRRREFNLPAVLLFSCCFTLFFGLVVASTACAATLAHEAAEYLSDVVGSPVKIIEVEAGRPLSRLHAPFHILRHTGGWQRGETSLLVAGGEGRTAWVKVRFGVEASVVVASHEIPRGRVVSRSDLLVRKGLFAPREVLAAITDPNQIVGMTAKRKLATGAIITPKMVKQTILVKRGDLVTVKVEAGDILILAKAKALKSGALGDEIPVQNISTGRSFSGVVAGRDQVVVGIGG